mgnify:CR=1 FL=1|tara:strand:- start:256 stop:558 length:303 start_codon:yes stop_codon:yes gene_type:complete
MNFNKLVKELEESIDDKGDWTPEDIGSQRKDPNVWDSQGKALQEGDIVQHAREDGEWIVISVEEGQRDDQGPGQVQLAELGEGIVADAKDLTKVGSPYGS